MFFLLPNCMFNTKHKILLLNLIQNLVSLYLLANKGNTYKEPTSDNGVSEASEHQKYQKPLHKPTQTKFTWKTMWQRDTFPRLVPAFGLLGKDH